MKTTESISHTKFETEFLLKFYVDQKCCEDNFKKNQNCEISDSVDSHHLGSWSRWWSEGRQEERVYQDSHQAHPHCRDSEKRQSRWQFIFCAFLLWYFNWWFHDLILFILCSLKVFKYNVLQTSSFWLLLQPSIFKLESTGTTTWMSGRRCRTTATRTSRTRSTSTSTWPPSSLTRTTPPADPSPTSGRVELPLGRVIALA